MQHRNETTIKLTTGAMFVAIFAMLLVLDRYTGSMFTTLLMYILPIPMVAYSSKYGWKAGLPVMVAMGLISMFVGNPLTIFYALSESFIGLVFGTCIYHKVETTKVMFVVILMSVLVTVIDTVFISALSGYDLTAQVGEMQTMLQQAMDQAGADTSSSVYAAYMDTSFMMRIMVIAVVLSGIIQGYLVYAISLLILRRLRFQIEKPKSLSTLHPPVWSGYVATLLTISYTVAAAYGKLTDQQLNVLQVITMVASLYLIFFGMIGVVLLVDSYISKKKSIKIIILVFAYLTFSQITMCIGILYLVTDFRTLMDLDHKRSQGGRRGFFR